MQITEVWLEKAAIILLILLTAIVARGLIVRAIRRVERAVVSEAADRRNRATDILRRAADLSDVRHRQRSHTMASLMKNATDIIVVALAVLMIMQTLGVPLGPILASAGIGGVALGFGAQSLVKDYLAGMFMIAEDQYGVGDWVQVNDGVQGRVEAVGLRVTRLRAFSGVVWYVRNGEITQLGNSSQGTSTAIIDVPIALEADSAQALDIMRHVLTTMAAEERWQQVLIAEPAVLGVDSMDSVQMILRATADTLANQQWDFQREALNRIRQALNDAGIQPPQGWVPS